VRGHATATRTAPENAKVVGSEGRREIKYINSVRASVTTYVKRVEANPSVSADAGRGLSDLDARIAAAKTPDSRAAGDGGGGEAA
jgi:hypothetical protein